jgi:hypothetical protein
MFDYAEDKSILRDNTNFGSRLIINKPGKYCRNSVKHLGGVIDEETG